MRLSLALLTAFAVAFPVSSFAQGFSLPTIDNSDGPDLRPLETTDEIRPYAAIGRLDTGDGFCTATLIAPDIILTAAHCLVTEAGRRRSDDVFTFNAGLRYGRVSAQRGVRRSMIHPNYDISLTELGDNIEAVSTDIALMQLDRPIVDGIAPILVNGRATAGDRVQIVSYGRDRENFMSLEDGCSVLRNRNAVVMLTCQVVPGSSGSPVLVETGVGLRIVSVVSASARWRATPTDGEDPVTLSAALDGEMQNLLHMMRQPSSTSAPARTSRLPQVQTLTGDASEGGLNARFVRP